MGQAVKALARRWPEAARMSDQRFHLPLGSGKSHFVKLMPNLAGPTSKRNAPSQRLPLAAAGSVLLHVAALLLIGLNIARLTPPPLAPVRETEVWLYALPPLERLKPHQAPAPAKTPPHQARAAPPARPPISAPRAAPRSAPGPAPRPAGPRPDGAAVPSPVAGAATKPGPAPEHGSTAAGPDGVTEALRTSVGCDADHVVHLTGAEQDKCAQKFGEAARRGQPFVKPGDRNFAAQAAADERRRQDRQGPLQDNVKACTGEGSNFGIGCLSDRAIIHVPQ